MQTVANFLQFDMICYHYYYAICMCWCT